MYYGSDILALNSLDVIFELHIDYLVHEVHVELAKHSNVGGSFSRNASPPITGW